MQNVTVTVSGGVVQNVDCPTGIQVTVEDYDDAVDGAEKSVAVWDSADSLEYFLVSVIRDDLPEESHLFVGVHDRIVEQAEQKFFDLCSTHVLNFDEYNTQDRANCLDQGYCRFGNGSVVLTWPEISQ